MTYAYLACPYTSRIPGLQQLRAEAASMAAAYLMDRHNKVIYSPLTHGHALGGYLPTIRRESHGFWMSQCLPMLKSATALYVLPLPNWRDSEGVKQELQFAAKEGIPIHFLQAPWQELYPFELENITPLVLDSLQAGIINL